MAEKDKPYRVYRGGRIKGPIRPLSVDGKQKAPKKGAPAQPARGSRAPRNWRRIALLVVLGLVLLAIVWTLLGYLAVRSGVKAANKRLPGSAKAALADPRHSILGGPSDLLVLGSDKGPGEGRNTGANRSDAIQLIRVDPSDHRIVYLFIPRDLRVDIPGHGTDKINAAFAYGGPALAIRTVAHLTGLPVNHVAVVDFRNFADIVDALGGVTIDVPERILSRFDCPFPRSKCQRWKGWRFKKGEQEMDGHRALVYARVRKNLANPHDSDISRGRRQQQVVQAIADKVVSPSGFLRMPFIGDDLVKPLATDLSTNELLALGWVKFRTPSDNVLRCRLGGTLSSDGSAIEGTEENVSVVAMVTGQTAPQPPPPDNPLFGPGCFVGKG